MQVLNCVFWTWMMKYSSKPNQTDLRRSWLQKSWSNRRRKETAASFPGVGLKLERFHLKYAENKHAIKKKQKHSLSACRFVSAACSNFPLRLLTTESEHPPTELKTSDMVLSRLVFGMHLGSSSPGKIKGKKGGSESTSERIKLSAFSHYFQSESEFGCRRDYGLLGALFHCLPDPSQSSL